MNADTLLDYAQFQLSPRRTRCELLVVGDGKTEKLASGFLKPFLTHLKVAEEQASNAVQLIKLEVGRRKNASAWFNKGTLERFVRFVSTPEALELVNTFDAEMSQLEGARKIYSQGAGDQLSGGFGENETVTAAAADITKKELLKAIDVRLVAVKQDLAMACARASAAGFSLDTVSELLLFADRFGALRLNEACTKFISLCQRRPELLSHQGSSQPSLPQQWNCFDDANIRSSSGSDMSIDEPEMETTMLSKPNTSSTGCTGPEFRKLSSEQLSQKAIMDPNPNARPLVEGLTKAKEDPPPSSALLPEPAQPSGGGSRRLSVQDRINLFESKQKEQLPSPSISSSNSGGGGIRMVAGKGEHRRLPSDVSMEKSVLRRWSGASDMSIDVNNNSNSFSSDRKESGSAAGTPTSSANSQAQSGSKTNEEVCGLKDTVASWPRLGPKDNPPATSSSVLTMSRAQAIPTDRDQGEDVILREGSAALLKTQLGPFTDEQGGRAQQGRLNDQSASEIQFNPISDCCEVPQPKDQAISLAQLKAGSEQNSGMKSQAASQNPSIAALDISGDQAGENVAGLKSRATSVTKFRTFAGKTDDTRSKFKGPLDSQVEFKASSGKVEDIATKSNLMPSQSQRKTFPRKQEEVGRKEAASSQASLKVPSADREEGFDPHGMNFHGQTSAPNQVRKLQGKGDETLPSKGSVPEFPGRKAKEAVEVLEETCTPSMEQFQMVKPPKGNHELQMKANELEKLFAAHKLRVHGDQTTSSRRSKKADDHAPKYAEKELLKASSDQLVEGNLSRGNSINGGNFDTNLLLNMVDNPSNSTKQKLGNFNPSDEFRGKLYEKYMQKRDAKLREEWGSKRPQKEAKMKAMHDILERSQAEMKAKFAGSADKQGLALAYRRAEKMRSFNARPAMKNKEQTLESLEGEGEEDLSELPEQVVDGHDALSGNESSSSMHSKKLVSSKSLSSATARMPAVPIPRASTKVTNSGSIRRRTQPENLLAQSVPNFSDIRKENTKPSAVPSKVTSRSQARAFPGSKSATEDTSLAKDEKSRKFHSLRKSSANLCEVKELSPLSSDGANLTQVKFSKEQMEQGVGRIQKGGESKPFLRKGNGIGPGAGSGIAKLRASTTPEVLKDEETSEGLVGQREDSPDIVKDDEEEFETTSAEGNLQATDFPVDSDSENGDPGSENGEALRLLSQADDESATVSSKFIPSAGHVQESPGESPGSWNSNIHHSFSYAQEASDVDASVDSPIGSPASWNSHPLNQMEVDAARMRKKWGSAQIPVLVPNAPHQSRKDVTKGFKRLLKFGRKSRGSEYLVNDWVSASTASEGDDDPEDGRDMVTRPSDDFRKSRMGYSVTSYDCFNEGDAFPEQVQSVHSSIPNAPANFKFREEQLSGSSLKAPRSFFSLSSFRSKGSDTKPR